MSWLPWVKWSVLAPAPLCVVVGAVAMMQYGGGNATALAVAAIAVLCVAAFLVVGWLTERAAVPQGVRAPVQSRQAVG
jgi:hypothetical protein